VNVCSAPLARAVSIKEIARLAQVSHSTVSRALRHSPLVNPETAERIRRIAEESGYCPSGPARSLVTRHTETIGVVVTSIADPFHADVVGGIEEAANERGFSVFLANSNADPERELRVVRSFQQRRVDGLIVAASRVGALHLSALSRMRIPIVLVNNQHPSEFVHSVAIANAQAAREATRHLVALGHRRIAYIGDRFGYQSDTERFAGYRQALAEADLPFEPELVVHGNGKPDGAPPAVARLLALAAPPTALFCYNDMTALGALRYLRSCGLRVPEDLSLVGFDDLFLAEYTDPPLTTMRQPMWQMGRAAARMLLDLLEGSATVDNVQMPAELILRQSTAPPRRRHG
jgi:DNA-binding LacI/PurR family transcriptional regulator